MNIIPITRFGVWLTVVSAVCSAFAQQGPGRQFDHAASHEALPGVPERFEVSFFAREPMVRNPCFIAFDERGEDVCQSGMIVKRGEDFRLRFGAVIPAGDGYDAAAACHRFVASTALGTSASGRDTPVQAESRT